MSGRDRAASTLRILLATDNHLGYAEKDPVRGDDSFRSFQEILQLARDERVDMLLLAGDLFHENKPSRKTMYQTMRLLRAYCMGDGAVKFQIVSDQSINFPNFGAVNYEDPNYNIELPVFSIHGNHDDPSRETGGAGSAMSQSLAALDLLSAANLVNYFGKSDKVDAIEVFPILTVKGDTKVAIYGLGSMRDERLNRMFAQQKVVFRRPAENPESWFSVFVIHQNRDNKGRGAKNCVPESFIPDFIDFVVWGHEHECLVDVEESVKGEFFITQPGSSVATSLIEGEAVTKQVAILEVHEQSFRVSSRVLKTVRPFKMGEISLGEVEELDPNDPDVTDRIRDVLEARVLELLAQAEEEAPDRPPELKQVLVRLRVEHTGFPVLVNQRFGSRFVGKVANPNDILLFYRRKKDRATTAKVDGKPAIVASRSGGSLYDPIRPARLDTVTIEELLSTQLHQPDHSLVFLPEQSLAIALEDYIVKNIPSALEEFVDGVLEETQKELESKRDAKSLQEILDVVEKKKDKVNAELLLQEEEKHAKRDVTGGRNGFQETLRFQSQTQPSQARNRADSFDDDDDMEMEGPVSKSAAGKARGSTPAGRFGAPRGEMSTSSANKRKPTAPAKRRAAARDRYGSDDGSDHDYDSAEQDRRGATRTSKSTVATQPARKASARAASTKGKAKQRELYSDDDEAGDNDGDEDFEMGGEDEEEESEIPPKPTSTRRGKGPAKSTRKPVAKPAGRKRLRKADSDVSDDDGSDTFSRSHRTPTPSKKRDTSTTASAVDEIDLCSSGSDTAAKPAAKKPPARSKPTPQPKITALFQKQAKATNNEDDIESDHEFTQFTNATPATVKGGRAGTVGLNDETASEMQQPSQSQSQSQFLSQFQSQSTGGAKKRKLPLSMLAASQSTTPAKLGKGDGVGDGAASALRKGWGRTRR